MNVIRPPALRVITFAPEVSNRLQILVRCLMKPDMMSGKCRRLPALVNVATFAVLLQVRVLLLAAHECPDFINLYSLGFHVGYGRFQQAVAVLSNH